MAVIDDLACWYEMLFLVSFNYSLWIQTVCVPLHSPKKMMTSSVALCCSEARTAWKCCEGCAAYPLHQSTSFKGQRALMKIWWKQSSSASNCCFDFFVLPKFEMWPNRLILTFLQIALIFFFCFACSNRADVETIQERKGQNKKTIWHLDSATALYHVAEI